MAEDIIVDCNGNGNYASIQEAINNADSGDSVIVFPGTYTENLLVDKSISIVSESGNPDNTIIMAANLKDDAIHVTADNVTIFGFNITRENFIIEDGEPEYIYSGIFLDEASNSSIFDNSISYSYLGVFLHHSNDNILSNNTLYSTDTAIGIHESSRNSLINNNAFFSLVGIDVFYGHDHVLINNNIIYCDSNGINIHSGSNTTVSGNSIEFCDNGIEATVTDNIIFTGNTIISNNCSFDLHWSGYLTITGNSVSNNTHNGLYMWNCWNSTIKNNIISNNSEYGIFIDSFSNFNLIYNNYLSNTNNAKDKCSNTWNLTRTNGTNVVGGPYLGGNFWASPNGTGFSQTQADIDEDGICDGICAIEGGNVDYHPLSLYSNPVPTASILWINPDYSYNENTVFFYGKGNSLFSPIVAYNWTSSIDGHLSDSASFSTSDLSVGAHTIYFSVEDSAGEWSDSVSSVLIIDTHRPAVNITLESQLGGLMNSVTISGDYAYVAQGQSLVVVDISNASDSSEIGRLALPSEIQDIVIEENYAYIADGESGLVIVNINDPAEPLLTSILGIEDYEDSSVKFAYSLDVSGNYAYIAADGTIVVDISDPESPTRVHGYYFFDNAHSIAFDDNYVYVSIEDIGLAVFDASNPRDLDYLNCWEHDDWVWKYDYWAWDLEISDNYAYVGTDSEGLYILNISNPSNPKLVGSYDAYGCIMSVDVVGNLTYMAVGNDSLIIVDVSDPSQPQLKSTYQSGFATDIAVSENHAYITTFDNGFCVIDVNDPEYPEYANNYDTTGFVSDMVVNENNAFCMPFSKGSISIIDVSTSSNPKYMGTYNAGNFTDFSLNDDYLYLTDPDLGLLIVNISDPNAAMLEGSYYEDSFLNVTVFGNYAYVLSENNLSIINVSNSKSPSLTGSYDVKANYVTVYGNYAYLADIEGGLIIIDVTDPTSPSLAGNYDSGDLVGVAVSSNYAYLADSDNGLTIIDISNPAVPSYIYAYDTIVANDIAIAENYLYAANGDIVVFDIRIPWLPSVVDNYHTAGYASAMDARGSNVYIADSYNGLVALSNEEVSESGSEPNAPSNQVSTTSSNSGGSGGGGGGGATGEKFENIAYKDVLSEFVSKGDVTSYEFDDEQNAIEYIRFQAFRNWGKISSTIEMLHGTSALVDEDAPDTVYCNVNMWVGKSGFSSSENIEDPIVGFRVEKDWLEENNINIDTIRLCRYSDDEWSELDTQKVSEDDTYVHFEASTPGFSPFAIVGHSVEEVAVEEEGLRSPESAVDSNMAEETDIPSEPKSAVNNWMAIGSLYILLIGGVVGFVLYRKRS